MKAIEPLQRTGGVGRRVGPAAAKALYELLTSEDPDMPVHPGPADA
jgi:hypothetical protein